MTMIAPWQDPDRAGGGGAPLRSIAHPGTRALEKEFPQLGFAADEVGHGVGVGQVQHQRLSHTRVTAGWTSSAGWSVCGVHSSPLCEFEDQAVQRFSDQVSNRSSVGGQVYSL